MAKWVDVICAIDDWAHDHERAVPARLRHRLCYRVDRACGMTKQEAQS